MKRDELKKNTSTMRGWYFADDADSVMDEMEARIKELEASQPKWISVDDRLPNDEEEVLVTSNDGIVVAFCDRELNYWYIVGGLRTQEVTHWMPLPQPQKSED